MFSGILTQSSTEPYWVLVERLYQTLQEADAVIIGAGSGLSTSAGLTYTGERFERNFGDFIAKYHISDLYSGGFYPYSSMEEFWAWWSRHIFINRYEDAPKETYHRLLELVRNRDYFVLTTNVDHQFQRAGFEKQRLFYTQGDYGLWQCSRPCHQNTYDNEVPVRQMLAEQKGMRIPTELVPHCPICGALMTMNLRCDSSFVQDAGWYAACSRYEDFLRRHRGKRILFLELGVGGNTPVIIKYPFWKLAEENPKAAYACVNLQDAFVPKELAPRSLCIQQDIGQTLDDLASLGIS